MRNQNIKIGIDLGTTNSEIAINDKGSIEILKNIRGDQYTPSVFGIDKSNNYIVGMRAYDKLFKDSSKDDFKNYKAEVKRLMGTAETIHFPRIDKELNAEEVSAEILKDLKTNITRKYPDFDTTAAVITIPAYFSTLQSEATKRAGLLAGFKHVVLLQEPIAAAISYGFMKSDSQNWLVYDLGGGTFDVALISSKGGSLSVLSHGGDNFLGGKDFDWALVEKVLIPKITEKYNFPDFNRTNKKYANIFSKLKYIAESAKVDLTQSDVVNIEIDNMGSDDDDQEVCLSFEFTRDNFESLISPCIEKTIQISRAAIKESGIDPQAIHKIILVGGPTQIPFIRRRLQQALDIEVDTSIDPLTAVCKGACIFAASQKIPESIFSTESRSLDLKKINLTLNFDSLTSEMEEVLTGSVDHFESTQYMDKELFIQIQSDNGVYNSSKVKLKNGKFFLTLPLQEYRENLFWIYLFDDQGNTLEVESDSFSITHGLNISGAPIPHSIGLSVAKRDPANNFQLRDIFEPIFQKGSILPLKSQAKTYRTVKELKKGQSNSLGIRVYEGESSVPDRNTFICEISIDGDKLPYHLPQGTEVEISLDVNESREVKVEALIPSLDLFLSARGSTYAESIDVKSLITELGSEKDRYSELGEESESEEINNLINSISRSLKNANEDEDDKRKADKELKELKAKLDDFENSTKFSRLVSQYNKSKSNIEQKINDGSTDSEHIKDIFPKLINEGDKAIESQSESILENVVEQLQSVERKILHDNPDFWIYIFTQMLEEHKAELSTPQAEYHINKANLALKNENMEEFKEHVIALHKQLPQEEQEATKVTSGITF